MDKIVNTSDLQITVPFTRPDGSQDSIGLQPKSFATLEKGAVISPNWLAATPQVNLHKDEVAS